VVIKPFCARASNSSSMIIDYQREGHCLSFVRIQSTICWAALVALPSGVAAALFKHGLLDKLGLPGLSLSADNEDDPSRIILDSAVWSSYTFLVGFLIVFRTSQAYHRFWEGSTAITQMSVNWFNACSTFTAFVKSSEASAEQQGNLQHLMVRLFSLLHAVALGEVYERKYVEIEHPESFKFQLLGSESLDGWSIKTLWNSECRVELVFQWIQDVVMLNHTTKMLNTPPPLLSRVFDSLASGMTAFQSAIKVSYVPFPRPYSQIIVVLLVLHWLVAPVVVCQWTNTKFTAALFSFVQVFTLLALNFIAVEIEDPFGYDTNDIDGQYLQKMFNQQLSQIMNKEAMRMPKLHKSEEDLMTTFRMTMTFRDLLHWAEEAHLGNFEDVEDLPNPGFRASHGAMMQRRPSRSPSVSTNLWMMNHGRLSASTRSSTNRSSIRTSKSSNRSSKTSNRSSALSMPRQDSADFADANSRRSPFPASDLLGYDSHRPPSPSSLHASSNSSLEPSGVPPVEKTSQEAARPAVSASPPGKLQRHQHQESRLAPTGATRAFVASVPDASQRQETDEIDSNTMDDACNVAYAVKHKIKQARANEKHLSHLQSCAQESGPEQMRPRLGINSSMTTQFDGIAGDEEEERMHPRLLGSSMPMQAGGDEQAPESEKFSPTLRTGNASKRAGNETGI